MVLEVKIGRRIHRKKDGNRFEKVMHGARNVLSIQQYMWRTILYAFTVASKKADVQKKRAIRKGKELDFTYSKIKYTEEEDINYDIEWLDIKIIGTEEKEREQYESAQKLFTQLENHEILKKYLSDRDEKIDEDISKLYNKKNKKLKKSLGKGYEAVKTQTLGKLLNEVGIIAEINWDKL